jgi:hypothetical protein
VRLCIGVKMQGLHRAPSPLSPSNLTGGFNQSLHCEVEEDLQEEEWNQGRHGWDSRWLWFLRDHEQRGPIVDSDQRSRWVYQCSKKSLTGEPGSIVIVGIPRTQTIAPWAGSKLLTWPTGPVKLWIGVKRQGLHRLINIWPKKSQYNFTQTTGAQNQSSWDWWSSDQTAFGFAPHCPGRISTWLFKSVHPLFGFLHSSFRRRRHNARQECGLLLKRSFTFVFSRKNIRGNNLMLWLWQKLLFAFL